MRAAIAGVVALGGVIACSPVELPRIEITDVEPGFAFTGDVATVSILGANFLPGLELPAGSGEANFDDDFGVWLVGDDEVMRPFSSVELQGFDRLGATLAPGTPAGVYDVMVEGPTGRRARKRDEFRVTDTKASRIDVDLQSPAGAYPLQTDVWVDIQLLDQTGAPMRDTPVEVVITAVDDEGTPIRESVYTVDALGNLRDTPDDDGIIGTLEDSAAIYVIRDVPGLVNLSVEPWDPELGIDGGDVSILFRGSEPVAIEFEPLPQPAVYVAGSPVTVQASLVRDFDSDERITLTLTSPCAFWSGPVEFVGELPTTFEIVPRKRCDSARIVEERGIVGGESQPFAVVPGPAASFDILKLDPPLVEAGDVVTAQVLPIDAFGNRTTFSQRLRVDSPDSAPEWRGCKDPDAQGASHDCLLVPTKAGSGLGIEVRDFSGTRTGRTNLLEVVARDEPVDMRVVQPSSAVAGQPYLLEVQPLDRYQNPIDASTWTLGPDLTLSDDEQEIECVQEPSTGSALVFECRLFTARSDARPWVTFTSTGQTVIGAPMEVTPGPFDNVGIEAPGVVTAGELVTIDVIAWDAWGNEVAPPSPALLGTLVDTAGSFRGPNSFLTDKRTSVVGRFEIAGPTRLDFMVLAGSLGSSGPIVVEPAPPTWWDVVVAPWAFVGDEVPVRVQARDDYGNPSPVDATLGLFADEGVVTPSAYDVRDGTATFFVSFDAPAASQTLEVVDAQQRRGSDELPVVSRCSSGPVARFELVGVSSDRVCLDPASGEVSLDVDATPSAPGATPLSGLAVAVDGQRQAWTPFPIDSEPRVSIERPGRPTVALLVYDSDLCGDVAEQHPWVANDDGSPAGPVTLSSGAPDVDDFGVVDIDVEDVRDCRGRPAAFESLYVRTSAGSIFPPVPTGEGLVVDLDGLGDASFRVETRGGLASGVVTVEAHADAWTATGSLQLDLVGDSVAPTIVEQDPSGSVLVTRLGGVRLEASEPLEPSTVVPSAFEVIGPGGPIPVQGILLDPEGRVIQLDLGTAIDAGDFSVTVHDTVEDRAGNRLAGRYAGVPDDYRGAFTFRDLPEIGVTCTADATRFRPDGDDGVGEDADTFDVVVKLTEVPRWWTLDVLEPDTGHRIRHLRVRATGMQGIVTWDGRDDRGIVVDEGAYELEFGAEDENGRRASPCQQVAWVMHGPQDPK